MSTAKRKRKKEGKRQRRADLVEARERRSKRRRQFLAAAVVSVLLLVFLLPTVRSNSKTSALKDCPKENSTLPRKTSFASAPAQNLDISKAYTAFICTDVGTVKVALNAEKAPTTVNNFVFLARNHFYNGLTFHRVVKDFVVQGGDPKGDGSGGPGYSIKDELPPSASSYIAGSLAMANSGPNTSGSQFFIVLSDNSAKSLSAPSYSLFGQVITGMDVVKKIESDGGTGSAGKPTKVHKMTRVVIQESTLTSANTVGSTTTSSISSTTSTRK